MTDIDLTIKNIKKIVDELPLLAEKHPEIKRDFDMYFTGVYECFKIEQVLNNEYCNIGCGLSNSARLFDPSDVRYYNRLGFNYTRFGKINFPSLYDAHGEYNEAWEYLFHKYWSECHPTFEDFIQRCKNLLEYYYDTGSLVRDFAFISMKIKI